MESSLFKHIEREKLRGAIAHALYQRVRIIIQDSESAQNAWAGFSTLVADILYEHRMKKRGTFEPMLVNLPVVDPKTSKVLGRKRK